MILKIYFKKRHILQKISNVDVILRIIKYVPLIFIIIASILTTLNISFNYTNNLKKEKERIKKEYIHSNKDIIENNINIIFEYINNKNRLSNDFLREEIKQQVYNAHSMMSSIYNKFKKTRTKEEITLIIKTALENMKFKNESGYYFIHDLKGIGIFHPINPELEGENSFYTQDRNGNFSIQESIKIANSKKGEGYQTWMYPKPNGTKIEYKKIGFIKKFEPYNWFIAVGEYVDDFQQEVKYEILKHIKENQYKNAEYIFVINKEGDFLLTRTAFTNVTDMENETLFSKVYNDFTNSKKENLYIEYALRNDKQDYSQKISYLKKVELYDWVIGTSFDLNNLDLKIKEKQKEIEKYYDEQIFITLITTIIMTALFLIISIFLSNLLKKKFLEYKESLEIQILKNQQQKETLIRAQEVAHLGDWKLNIKTRKAYWSNEIIRIFGIDKKDKDKFGPEFLKGIMLEEDKICFEDSLNKCIDTGKEHKCVYRIKRANNEIIWIECRGRLDINKLFIVGTIQDITENKKQEIEKQEKDGILYQQSKMAAMGEMIGNIAHQWRQPLSVISTAATGIKLQKQMNCLSDNELIFSLTAINNSAQHLSTTIEDFRGFFDPSNNKITEFTISNTLNKTLNLINAQFVSKEIKIIKNIEDFNLLSIENELIQVLINILNNARDELVKKEDGKRLIFITTYIKDNISYIEILDNAGGIQKNIINRIFEPYFTTKHKAQGTGIGLYMSKEIIENHLKGNLLVSNEDYIYKNKRNTGAKFTIKIKVFNSL